MTESVFKPATPVQAPPVVVARGLTKIYDTGGSQVHALAGVDVEFHRGAFTAIMGPSGSGKSTLMHCLAGLDVPTSGTVHLGRTQITGMRDGDLTLLRRDRIGFIFQSFNLLPMLTAEQNILLPSQIAKRKFDQARFDRHHVGYGIGLEPAEPPRLAPGGDALEMGMVLRVETPYYLVGEAGLNVKETVLVTRTGAHQR